MMPVTLLLFNDQKALMIPGHKPGFRNQISYPVSTITN